MIFAAMTEEDVLYCCGMCPILPLVILFAVFALIRNSLWSASFALLIAGLPYVILLGLVAVYDPPIDEEVAANQFTGRSAVGFYDWIVAAAGLSFLVVGTRRMVRRKRRAGDGPTLPTSLG